MKIFRNIFSMLVLLTVLTAEALEYKDTPKALIVTVSGHTFAINKKTIQSWSGKNSLTVDNDKNLKFGFHAGIEDEIFPKGVGQLVASKSPVKIKITNESKLSLTVRAEYCVARVGKEKEADYAGLKIIYYYSFTEGIPGVAINARLLAEKDKVLVRSFNGAFGKDFASYTTRDGQKVTYPDKSWKAVKGGYVIADRPNGDKIVTTVTTHNQDKGFSWVGPANQWRKISLAPGEFVEVKGMIGFVKDNNDVENLKNFVSTVNIPKEGESNTGIKGEVNAVPVSVGKDGWPTVWPEPMIVRQGAGWVRPDTTDTWKGDDNLSFTAAAGFDADYFYFRADVRDDVFMIEGTDERIWAGDCMQVAFDPLSEKSLTDNYILLGFTASDSPGAWCWKHPDSKFANSDIRKICRVRSSRGKGTLVYEVAIPWSFFKPFTIDRGKFGFNIVMLDNDGFGVKHWMGITDGIAHGQNPAYYKPLYFANPEKVLLAEMNDPSPLLRLDSDIAVAEKSLEFSVSEMLPEELDGAELIVTAGKKQFIKKVAKGFNSFRYTIEKKDLTPGMLNIAAVLRRNGKELYRSSGAIRVVSRGSIEELCKQALAASEELKKSVARLEKHGKNTAYFTNRIALTDYFVRMVRLDNGRDVIYRQPKVGTAYQRIPVTPEYRTWIYRRSIKNLEYCIKMLQDGVAEAENIIAGKAPDLQVVPMPVRGKTEIRNGGFYLNGKEMFFLGANTWQVHYTQLQDIAGAGLNFFDINANKSRFPADMKPFEEEFNPDDNTKIINPGIFSYGANLGMYFFCREMAGSGYVYHLTPGAYEKNIQINRESWKFQAEQPNLLYLVSHPESFPRDSNIKRFEKNVQDHLRQTFGSVEKMNKRLGTSYKAFEDFRDADRYSNPALKYEVFRFERNANFSALEKANADRRGLWKKPTTTHVTTSHWIAWDVLINCADYEAIYNAGEIAGYDAGVRWESRDYAASWEAVLMLCDFSRSLFPEKPVTNNECHNFPINGSGDISSEFVYTSQISEMLHGRNAGVMWVWEKNFHGAWGSYAFTKANCFHAASRAILDARRLADEIAAFRSEKRQFGIFYGLPAFSDTGNYQKVNNLYQGAFFHGVAPGFITEKNLLEGKFADYKLILVPDARRVSDEVFAALMKRAENGTKVVRFGEKSLTLDEYGNLKPERAAALAKLPLFKVAEPQAYFSVLAKLFAESGIRGKYDVTGKKGEKLWALEYRSTADGKLLYVINWSKKAQTALLPEGEWLELFSGKDSACELVFQPLDVKLFRRK